MFGSRKRSKHGRCIFGTQQTSPTQADLHGFDRGRQNWRRSTNSPFTLLASGVGWGVVGHLDLLGVGLEAVEPDDSSEGFSDGADFDPPIGKYLTPRGPSTTVFATG